MERVNHCPAEKLLPALTVKTFVPTPIRTELVLVSRVSLVFIAATAAVNSEYSASNSFSSVPYSHAHALIARVRKVAGSVPTGVGGGGVKKLMILSFQIEVNRWWLWGIR